MLQYLLLALTIWVLVYTARSYIAFRKNLAAAKQSGLPYICMPVWTFNTPWLLTHRLWLPLINRLPYSWSHPWIEYALPEHVWTKKYDTFKDLDSDILLLVSPKYVSVSVASAEAITQITKRRDDFPKPIWMYASVDIFGKNVVTTEGSIWRHHRKITSPPFTERNNVLVWEESLRQGQSMMRSWMSEKAESSGPLKDVAAQAMRLSLYVISRAGFGVPLYWPHEQADQKIPEGHTLSYKDALSGLLENIIVVMLTPRWLLSMSPLKIMRVANEAFVEWGKYMREMYMNKRAEVKNGGSREGMDLMGALVKGAGITTESLNSVNGDPEKSPSTKQMLTDAEIFGNAFVFILAGHETAANTIHFSTLLLAMHPASQRHLQQDLDATLGDRPASEWSYEDDMPRLFGSMCGAVMNEQLRLIPPVLGIPKSTPEGRPQGLQINGHNVTIPGGANISLNTAAVHRNPKYWPHTSEQDLVEFRPERWLLDPTTTTTTKTNGTGTGTQEEAAYATEEGLDFDGPDKRPDTAASLFRPAKGAYVPFSDGYRSCLGRRFAQVEILAVLAVIFKTWSVELDVSDFLDDEAFERATEEEKRAAWRKADARARHLLDKGMSTIITLQMRGEKVPLRFAKRGKERFGFL